LIGRRPRLSEEEARRRWLQLQGEVGAFDYDEEGFSYPFETGTSVVRWAEVDRIVGYKMDLFTLDEICVELLVGDRAIRFSESTPGWYPFLTRLKSVFPSIPNGWDWDVMMPALTGNYTVLYERKSFRLPGENNFYGIVSSTEVSVVGKAFRREGWRVRKSGWEEMEASNPSSEIGIARDWQGVLLSGSVAIRSGVVAAIDRVLYTIGSPYRFEVYDEEKKLVKEKNWP
jgi:hypothetical protein